MPKLSYEHKMSILNSILQNLIVPGDKQKNSQTRYCLDSEDWENEEWTFVHDYVDEKVIIHAEFPADWFSFLPEGMDNSAELSPIEQGLYTNFCIYCFFQVCSLHGDSNDDCQTDPRYWQCNCDNDESIKDKAVTLECPDCESIEDECPDARISDLITLKIDGKGE